MAAFEVQISASAFLRAQRARLKSEHFCPPAPIPLPDGTAIQIQRLEFGPNELRRGPARTWNIRYVDTNYGSPPQYLYWTDNDADGFSVHIAQEVSIHTSSFQAVTDHPNQAPPPLDKPIRVTPVFELDYYPYFDEGCLLKMELDHIEWPEEPSFLGLPAGIVKAKIEEYLPLAFRAQTVPFNFVQNIPKNYPEIANAGVSLSADNQVLSFRADPFGSVSGNSDFVWTNFFRGLFPSLLAGHDWAMCTDGPLLAAMMATQVEASLKEKPIPKTSVQAVDADFQVIGGKPTVVIHVGVFADVPVIADQYYNFSIFCTIGLETSPLALVFDIDLSDIKKQTAWIGLLFERLRWIFPPLGWTLELAFAEKLAKLRHLPGNINIDSDQLVCEVISPSVRRCRRSATIPTVPNVRLAAEAVNGFPAGMTINGRLEGGDPDQPTLAVEVGKFAWTPLSLSCGAPDTAIKAAREHPENFACLYLEHELKVVGQPPTSDVYFCSLEVINDPQNLYPRGEPQITIDPDLLPTKIKITMTGKAPLPAYPFDMIVRTSAGVQLVRAPAPEPFSEADGEFIAGSIKVQMLKCPMMPAWWAGLKNGFNVAWIEDPLLDPDPEMVLAHELNLKILGAAAQPLAARVTMGRAVRELRPADGARFSVTVPQGARLTLMGTRQRLSPIHATSERKAAKIELQVRPLVLHSQLKIGEPILHISLFGSGRNGVATVATQSRVLLLDLAPAGEPAVRRQLRLRDLRGAVAAGGGILAWTSRGSKMLAGDLCDCRPAGPPIGPVRCAASSGNRIFAATGQGVAVLDSASGRKIGFMPLQGITCILATNGQLYAGGDFGIAAADLAGPEPQQFRQMCEAFPVRRLSHGFGQDATIVASDVDDMQTEFAVESAGLRPCASLRGGPMFGLYARLDDTVIYCIPESDSLVIARFAPARPVVLQLSKKRRSTSGIRQRTPLRT